VRDPPSRSPRPADAAETDDIPTRKAQHLAVTARGDVESRTGPGWADIHLLHEAIPRVDRDAVGLGVSFLGRPLRAPLMIAAMTGGHPAASAINACLARAAEKFGLAMGVGSQRAAIRNPQLTTTYRVAREHGPSILLIGNLGAAQLIPQGPLDHPTPALTPEQVHAVARDLGADAIAIHFNFLQESIQAEGDRRAVGILPALRNLVATADVPILAKETGAGVSRGAAWQLAAAGVAAIDVGGVGGTTFAAVEGLRSESQGDAQGARLGEVFRDWGIPTAVSLAAAAPTGLPLIATGGVRSGVDAAKALALGATLVGVARPLLQAALAGGDAAVEAWIGQFLHELRLAVFLTGARSVADLRACPRVIRGDTQAWLTQLGYWEAALPHS
jgi:isopentenyl-diphosphate delta-isomerase